MDELEISGKRFISTRLAAKQHKYHADYIGQLVRGKKIVGQKVGRSWYVDAESLAAYFANPDPKPQPKKILSVAPIEKAEEEVEEAPEEVVEEVEETPEPVVEEVKEKELETIQSFRRPLRVDDDTLEPMKEETVVEEMFVEIEPEAVRDSIHIPIRRTATAKNSGLRYIDDTEPALPEIKKIATKKQKASAKVMAADEPEEIFIASDVVAAKPGMLVSTFSIVTLGAVVFAVVAIGSLLVNSTTVIEAGKAAAVGYSLN